MTTDAASFNVAVDDLLEAMDALAQVGRGWHPDRAAWLVEAVRPHRAQVADALQAFERADWPAEMAAIRESCLGAAGILLGAYDGLEAADPQLAYSSLRLNTLVQETLYPAASMHRAISRFFLPPEQRTDDALLARLEASTGQLEPGGVAHFANDRGQRGGFSLYVPEYIDRHDRHPLVIALHGGSGHGRDFIWTWLKAARASGVVVVSPTSIGRTWALQTPELDSQNVRAMLEQLVMRYPIDLSRVLLTGMSDGGTFSATCGVLDLLPATHIAPIASSFSPRLLELAAPDHLKDRPFYLVHGEHDSMFPVEGARAARDALEGRGARVVYREIADLGHAYPREENVRIVDWFMATR